MIFRHSATILVAGGVLTLLAGYSHFVDVLINGKPAAKPSIEQGGETYVAISALRAAGAEVTLKGSQTLIRFIPVAGAGPEQMIEGPMGEWLSNGLLRVRVTNLVVDGSVARVDVEVGNTSPAATSAFNLGLSDMQLFGPDGAEMGMSGGSSGPWAELSGLTIPKGGVIKRSLAWYTQGTIQPDKAIIRVKTNTNYLTQKKQKHSVKNPSFRINLAS